MKIVDCIVQLVRTELSVAPLREQFVEPTQFVTEFPAMRDCGKVPSVLDRSRSDGAGDLQGGDSAFRDLRLLMTPYRPEGSLDVPCVLLR